MKKKNKEEVDEEDELSYPEVVYLTPKWVYLVSNLFRFLILGIGIYLTVFITKGCLHTNSCDITVTVFLSLLALACFQAAGVPVDKLVNIKLT